MSTDPLATLIRPELAPVAARRWVVAYSGGLDSTVLLHAAAVSLRHLEAGPELVALHVNHGLQIEAVQWAEHCAMVCESLRVPLHMVEVVVREVGDGPEAAARKARYTAFEDFLASDDLLLQAHHLDDQLETFFLSLMRGASVGGLVGMPGHRSLGPATLWRPFLELPRTQLEAAASAAQLQWIEDRSNADPRFDRNYLRREVLPLLEKRWPGYRLSVARAMSELGILTIQLADRVDARLQEISSVGARGEPVLTIVDLLAEGSDAAASLLRAWLDNYDLVQPSRAMVSELLRQLAAGGRGSLEGEGFRLDSFSGELYLLPRPVGETVLTATLRPGQDVNAPAWGLLAVATVTEGGLRPPVSGSLSVRDRRGGERCRPHGRVHSQTLKKLLQELAIPPWLRAAVPLIFDGDNLVAVADLWICEGFAAEPGQPGWRIDWTPPGLARSRPDD